MSNAKRVDPAKAAELFLIHDQVHEPMHDRFLWATMQRRDAEAAAIPEWEELRDIASKIKEHTLTHLDHYLEEFEANATKRGAHVHWALDAAEPLDRQLAVQVPVRFAHDEAAQPVLEPGRLRHDDRRRRRSDDEREHDDERVNEPSDNPH